MERRDIDYILPQYIRSYLYYTKNQDPEEIVFPMFHSVRHPLKPTVMVPIRWVPELDILAQEIEADGSSERRLPTYLALQVTIPKSYLQHPVPNAYLGSQSILPAAVQTRCIHALRMT